MIFVMGAVAFQHIIDMVARHENLNGQMAKGAFQTTEAFLGEASSVWASITVMPNGPCRRA